MEKKLKRDGKDKMIAGVASGLANYFELDVTWVRIAFGIAAFFGGSGGFFAAFFGALGWARTAGAVRRFQPVRTGHDLVRRHLMSLWP